MEQDILSQHYKMWTREATSILIDQYKTNECMWMTTSPFYRNKQKRNEALINIAVAVSKLRKQTTAEDIKNKINGIRTQYVSEINKLILASNRGEPYEPTLWCFEALSFLKPFTQPKQKSNNGGGSSGDWTRTFMPKPTRPQFVTPTKPQIRQQQQEQQQSSTPVQETSNSKMNFIFIKEEIHHDNDIEIIEDDEDNFHTDDDYSNSHSSYHPEDKSYKEEQESFSPVKEPTPPVTPNLDSKFEEQEQTSNVRSLFTPSGIGAEITLVPKKNLKRKSEEIVVNHVEEKKKKTETDSNEEMDNRINIFGKFVMSQMKIITDKVLLLKLEHTIQNAIIEAQLKQIELDESKKEKNEPGSSN